MLDRRYDEMESGKVQGIDGEEAYRRLMENTQARRHARHESSIFATPPTRRATE
jgi:hypothetical protein